MPFEALTAAVEVLAERGCHTLEEVRLKELDDEQKDQLAVLLAGSQIRTFRRVSTTFLSMLFTRNLVEEVHVKGGRRFDDRAKLLLPDAAACTSIRRLRLENADALIPAVIGHAHLQELEAYRVEPKPALDLIKKIGSKGGPSTVRLGMNVPGDLQDQFVQLAAQQKHAIELTISPLSSSH